MNVTCPTCATVFRVDPAKIPERGIRARCSSCAGIIAIQRPAAPPAVPPLVAEFPDPGAVAPPSSPREPAREAAPPPPREPTGEVAPLSPPREPAREVAPPPPPREPTREVAPASPPEPPGPGGERPGSPVPPAAVPFGTLPEREGAPPPPRPVRAPAAQPPAAGGFSNPFLQQDPSTRARRLARALVSDLVVYHPEKRQRGLDEGNLKDLFAEEIRKSWEEYTEQVGEELAKTTPYFTDALNEILAEGQALFG